MKSLRLFAVFLLLGTIPLLQACVAGAAAGVAAGLGALNDRRSTGTLIDDQIIEIKALSAVRKDQDLWEQVHVNATSFNNVVLLTGEAPNQDLREQVANIVRNINEVRKVHNELQVAAPSSMVSRSADTWITGKVKTALLNTKKVDVTRIKIVTENGVVYLLGLVNSQEADAATDIARRVSGVQRVVKVFEYL